MFAWIKKLVLKSIVKDITKNIPTYGDMAIIFIEQHIDEIVEKVKTAIRSVIENEIAKIFNK